MALYPPLDLQKNSGILATSVLIKFGRAIGPPTNGAYSANPFYTDRIDLSLTAQLQHYSLRRNRVNTFAVIWDTASSTKIELTHVIDPTEKTAPLLAVS